VVWVQDFDKAKAKFLRVADNRVPQLAPAYDDDILIDHLKDLKLDNFEYDFLKLEKYDKFLIDDLAADDPLFEDIMPGYAEMANGPTHAQDAEPVPRRSLDSRQPDPLSPPHNNELPQELSRHDVPDILFPADDTLISIESNVPMLSLKYQAEGYIPPLTKWGEVSRKDKNVKTWVFYIDDVKFVNLWYDPTGPLQGNAVCCVEPNFSTSPEFPRALALGDIYKKRWIARYWQSKGMKIIVDINIDQHLYDIALLGVPKGWRAYATRGQTSEIPTILTEYELAKERAGSDDLFFMVYGGGKKVEELCRGRGWTWGPERMDQVWHPEKNSDGLPIKVERR